MRRCALPLVLLAASCGFDPRGASIDAADDDDDAMVDAPNGTIDAIDAPTDAAIDGRAPCPSGYTVLVGTQRYARRATLSTIPLAKLDCDDDLVGRTHLATFEAANLDAVVGAAGFANTDEVYIGGECNTTGAPCDKTTVWFWTFSGTAVAATLWEEFEPSGQFELSYTERANGTWQMVSSAGQILRPYLCECEP